MGCESQRWTESFRQRFLTVIVAVTGGFTGIKHCCTALSIPGTDCREPPKLPGPSSPSAAEKAESSALPLFRGCSLCFRTVGGEHFLSWAAFEVVSLLFFLMKHANPVDAAIAAQGTQS